MPNEHTDAVSSEIIVFDKSNLLSRLGGDEELLMEIIETYVDDIPQQIATLKEALANNDATRVRHQGHTIKGASGNIGAFAMQDISAKVELAGKNGNLRDAASYFEQVEREFQRFLDVVNMSA